MSFLKWQDFLNRISTGVAQRKSLVLLSVLVLFVCVGYGQEHAVAGKEPGKYAGAEACKTCHEDVYNNFDKSPHWKTTLDNRGGPSKQGCEACHGAAAAHIDDPGDPKNIFSFKTASAKEVNERCLECHTSGKDHMNFSRSAHSDNNLSCLSCHSAHHGVENQHLLVKAQPALCYTCHQKVKPRQRGIRFATRAMQISRDLLCSSTSRSRQRGAWPAIRHTVPQILA